MKVHVIHPDGVVRDVELIGLDNPSLRNFVGGNIEYVAVLFNGKPATMIVNETGAVRDSEINPTGPMQPNARATAIYWTATIIKRTGVPFDPLRGPMIHGTAVLIEIDKRDLRWIKSNAKI